MTGKREKHRFWITEDYGMGGTGFIVMAYSREQIDRIFDLPRCSGDYEVWEEGSFEESPLYRRHKEQGYPFVTYDVDYPTGGLKATMIRNKVILPTSKMPPDGRFR